jgi:hypothetical protein
MKHQWNIWDDFLIPLGAFIVLALFMCANAHADDSHYGNFITTQPKLEFVFDAALMADIMTTADIKNHPQQCSPAMANINGTGQQSVCSGGLVETNPILGAHPSDAKIAAYGLTMAGLHAAITYEMVSNDVPRAIINAWELVSIGVEAGYVARNYRLGLRVRF